MTDNQTPTNGDYRSIYSENYLRGFIVQADRYAAVNAVREVEDDLSWDGLLLADVYAALAESEPSLRIDKLNQVAATVDAEVDSLCRLIEDLEKPAKSKALVVIADSAA